MNVRGFRLNTGEIVITQIKERNDVTIKLKDAVQMVMQEIEPGRAGVGLQPFIPYGDNVELYIANITAEFDLDQQVENEYNRLFGSGIYIAAANELPIQN